MALPSSSPRPKVAVMPSAGDIRIQPIDLSTIDDAYKFGRSRSQELQEDILLRPKQIAADQERAVKEREEAITAQDQTKSDRRIIPLKEEVTISGLQGDAAANRTRLLLESVKEAATKNPVIQSAIAQIFTDKIQTESAGTAAGRVSAEADLARRPTDEAAKTAGSQAALVTANADLSRRPQEEATKTEGAAKANILATVDTNAAANQAGNIQTALEANQVAATGAAKVAAAPASSPVIQAASETGAKAQAATNAIIAQRQLSAVAGGVGAGLGSLEGDKTILDTAQALQIPVANPDGTPKTRAQLSVEITQRRNIQDAQKVFETLREDVKGLDKALEGYQQMVQIIGDDLSTGYIYGTRLGTIANGLAAQFGSPDAQRREQLLSIQSKLVPYARDGLPGSASNLDVSMFKNSLSGPDKSPQTNANIATASIAGLQRKMEKPTFYSQLIGPFTAQDADTLWKSYIDSNLLFDPVASVNGNVVANPRNISPAQYVDAIKNPESIRSLVSQVDVSTLPYSGNTTEELAAVPANEPYVRVQNARGSEVPMLNPKFWQPILAAAQKYQVATAPAPAAAAPVTGTPEEIVVKPLNAVRGGYPGDITVQKRK